MEKKPSTDASGSGLTLEPCGDGRLGAARYGVVTNQADRRTPAGRRLVYDRRELIRFEGDRRAGKDRRAGVDPWGIP